MSERGVFAVDRGLWEHEIFAREPFSEREAWIWLVGAAAWKAGKVRVGRVVIELCRGQAAFSERFLAERWQWSKSRVHRFLNRLKTEAMVNTETDHETNRITICNYEKYAFDGTRRRTRNEPPTEPLADQSRTKEEELKEGKKEKEDLRAVVPTRPSVSAFEEFWKVYPKRLGANPRKPALQVFETTVKQGADPAAIIEGARRCAAADRDKIGTPYIPQAVKWLRDRRWEDYQPPPTAGPVGPPPGAPSDEELRKRYGNPAIPAKTETAGQNGLGADHAAELPRQGFEIRPSFRQF